MSAEPGFTLAHVSSIAARAAELERIGEELQDPDALVRAARLYTLAVRITDDIDQRESLPFMQSDLSRVRDELRQLAADTAAGGGLGARGLVTPPAFDSTGELTRMFREVAARIEQRIAQDQSRSR